MVIAGGNCSVQGFNADGDDHFWTVAHHLLHCLICNFFTLILAAMLAPHIMTKDSYFLGKP